MAVKKTNNAGAPQERHTEIGSLFEPNPAKPIKEALPFTFKEIKDAIPAELFEANLATSWYYICKDLALFAITAYVTMLIQSMIPETLPLVRAVVWMVYACVQGTTGFGLWVIAHECGHRAYFGPKRQWLNTLVGYTCHTAMLVPYHSWRISHATHHKFTNHLEIDTAFPPRRYPGIFWKANQLWAPIAWLHVAGYLVLGWIGYLIFGLEGNWYSRMPIHFDPTAPIFQEKDRSDVIITDLGLVVVGAALWYWAQCTSLFTVMCWYFGPWAVCHAWLVVITFLQHTDRDVPHYDSSDWEFVKGALSTVDRDYGIFNKWMHHITNAHVVHHLFSTMPFYHAVPATKYVRGVIGDHYKYDSRPLITQLWESWFAHQASFLTNPLYEGNLVKKTLKKG